MIIKDIETKKYGTASTISADEFIPHYAEGVEKFLRDNQPSMGDKWVEEAGKILYNFNEKDDEGNLKGSSTTIGVAIATFFPDIHLITGQQLLGIYERAGNKNPFGRYINFGVQIHGSPNTNPEQAKILLEDLRKQNIGVSKEGKVFNFNQLRLVADKNVGLAYKLSKNFASEIVANVSDYPFKKSFIGKGGLFGAYLSSGGDWYADSGDLHYSNDGGRVVCYDAEGVAPQKYSPIPVEKKDLIKILKTDFLSRF